MITINLKIILFYRNKKLQSILRNPITRECPILIPSYMLPFDTAYQILEVEKLYGQSDLIINIRTLVIKSDVFSP